MTTKEKFEKYIMGTYTRQDVCLDRGIKEKIYDEAGKQYIDFGSGIGTNSLGICDDRWVSYVCNQAHKIQHTSNLYYNAPQADVAENLCERTGYSKVFFGNSGAEANECAIKLARKYSFDKYGKGRHNIITLVNSFHGRTLTTLSATGQDVFHNYFFPFTEGFIYVEANNIDDLKAKLDDTVCAVMFEYIQGEGGVLPLEREFIDAIYSLCEEKDVLTIADEVQTGVGRTGKFLAGENFGKRANITTLAKGIAGGLPMGVCLADEKCCDVLSASTHGSTFGGNPVSSAGAMAVLEKVNNDFMEEVIRKGVYLKGKLLEIEEIERVDGMGLMLGAKLKTKKAGDVVKKAVENGVIVLTAKEKLRFLPPLTISFAEIDKGIEILKGLLTE